MDPDEFKAPQSPEQAPPSPKYVPGPDYAEYVASSNDEMLVEDRPLPTDASPTALSPGCVANFDPLEEDLEVDLVDYPVDGGYKEEEESSKDDDDEKEKQAFEEDEDEEEEHLALATLLHYLLLTIPQPLMAASTEALIVEYASAPTPPSPPPSLLSPLSPLSSPLPKIPSPPIHTSPTYNSAPLGYRAAIV
nr:hypothetical protein [Tanacetum cinerariifolium]